MKYLSLIVSGGFWDTFTFWFAEFVFYDFSTENTNLRMSKLYKYSCMA